jgi:preprotein translocase subunit YajC
MGSNATTLVLIALMVVFFYFLILRPQKKRQQAIQQTLASLTPGSRVLLGSGLFGTLVSIGDRQAVLEISPGVHLTVLKQAIVRVAGEADEDTVVEAYDDDEDDAVDLDEPTSAVTDPSAVQPLPPEGGSTSNGSHTTPSAGADTPRRLG